MRVATDAVQLSGGPLVLARDGGGAVGRDAMGAQIYEGTNKIQRLIVSNQVLRRAGGGS